MHPQDIIPIGLCQCGCGEPTRLAPATNSAKGWRKGTPLRYRLGHHIRLRIVGSMDSRACGHCGVVFRPRRSVDVARYCSRACYTAAARNRPRDPIADAARFWQKVDKTDACWRWLGARRPSGHGSFGLGPRQVGAHCYAWALASGVLPQHGQWVCHTCDNPWCVRNDEPGTYTVDGQLFLRYGHLFLATVVENVHDAQQKGRMPRSARVYRPPHPQRAFGPRVTIAKLTADDVRAIRARYDAGGISHAALGREYGVSTSAIAQLLMGRSWAHVR